MTNYYTKGGKLILDNRVSYYSINVSFVMLCWLSSVVLTTTICVDKCNKFV